MPGGAASGVRWGRGVSLVFCLCLVCGLVAGVGAQRGEYAFVYLEYSAESGASGVVLAAAATFGCSCGSCLDGSCGCASSCASKFRNEGNCLPT